MTVMKIDSRLYNSQERFEQMLQELPGKKTGNTIGRSDEEIEMLVDELIVQMTLEEKIGQMNQSVAGNSSQIGMEFTNAPSLEQQIKQGEIGSVILMAGPETAYEYQRLAVEESRLHIPLLFCKDIIHGCQTTFPIPLGWSCSFDLNLIENAARVAAREATALGVMYAFAPMVDIARDPRWGRIAEGNGEDPYLCARICEAIVRGYQGDELHKEDSMLACLKHYVGYSAAEGGRDYNTCEISETTLRNVYLQPFIAGINAQAASVMSAFNIVNGVPVTGNKYVLRDILRDELNFKGIVVSDYAAVEELMTHGVAKDGEAAAIKALEASLDIEMATGLYGRHLPQAASESIQVEAWIDEAVKRILTYKYKSGLMDDPYKAIRPEAMQEIFSGPYKKVALNLARESIVLLKNAGHPSVNGNVLPLDKGQRIALIGPKADSKDILGPWQTSVFEQETVTLREALEAQGCTVCCVSGCGIDEASEDGAALAQKAVSEADVVVLAVGESRQMSGEAASRQQITLPDAQMVLADRIVRQAEKHNKPVVTILFNGRPLLLNWFNENTDAIVEAWFPGCEGGRAIADILLGNYNPSGHLSVSIPASAGQIPVYYNHLNTGRPFKDGMSGKFYSRYIDGPNAPLFPFGYGLSYTKFKVEGMNLSADRFTKGERLKITVNVFNIGECDGETVVMLFIRDVVASIARPVKELKGFLRIGLKSKESKTVCFELGEEDLSFYNEAGQKVTEPGEFLISAGLSSADEDCQKAHVLFLGTE